MRALVAVIMSALAIAGCGNDANIELGRAVEAKYANGPEGEVTFERKSHGYVGTSWWNPSDPSMLGEGLGWPLHECSDAGHRCLQWALDVFAVPRGNISLHQEYEIAGARLRVLACADASCSLAIIRSDCPHYVYSEENFAACRREKAKDTDEGKATEFLYDRQRGVVLFGEDIACPSSFGAADCTVTKGFTLTSKVGLLGAGG